MNLIDWNNPQLMPAPRKDRPNRNETKYLCECQTCGHQRWLTKSAARHAEETGGCRSCASRKNGKKVWKLYGDLIIEKAIEYRLENPSSLERIVIEALDNLGWDYSREVVYHTFAGNRYVDFKVASDKLDFFIEADGRWVHEDRLEADRFLDGAMRAHGHHLFRISDIEPDGTILTVEVAQERIKAFHDSLPAPLPF